jgi:CRISPR-associated protein Cas5d
MEIYSVLLEISGPSAMWTRPDTGDAPISYPAPTFAAVKGIFESILWLKQAEVVPKRVDICRPIVFHGYTTNYGGPLRKSRLLAKGGSYQLIATVLVNVCYRLYAEIQHDANGGAWHSGPAANPTRTTNGAHAYVEMFNRRLVRGQLHSVPCLGWNEFVPDYAGPFRPETRVCEDINLTIPSMLKTCFPEGKQSPWRPRFLQDVTIRKGVLEYAQ